MACSPPRWQSAPLVWGEAMPFDITGKTKLKRRSVELRLSPVTFKAKSTLQRRSAELLLERVPFTFMMENQQHQKNEKPQPSNDPGMCRCVYRGTLKDVQIHRKECPCVPVKCTHGCGYGAPRSLVGTHEEHCNHRQVICSFPGCTERYRKKDEGVHRGDFKDRHIEGLLLKLHQKEEDYQRVQEELRKAKEKPEDWWQHLEDQKRRLDDEKTKFEEQRKTIQQMDQEIEEHKARIKELETKSTAQKKEIQELTDRIRELERKTSTNERKNQDSRLTEVHFEMTGYRELKVSGLSWTSQELNTDEGHKYLLKVMFGESALSWKLFSVKSDIDDNLQWPLKKCGMFTLVNSVGGNNENYYFRVSWERPQQELEPVDFLPTSGPPDALNISLDHSKVFFFSQNEKIHFRLFFTADHA